MIDGERVIADDDDGMSVYPLVAKEDLDSIILSETTGWSSAV